jgi:hypothetical protein
VIPVGDVAKKVTDLVKAQLASWWLKPEAGRK